MAEIVRQARARVLAVDVKAAIEQEPPQAIEHEGTAETVAFTQSATEATPETVCAMAGAVGAARCKRLGKLRTVRIILAALDLGEFRRNLP